MLESSLLQASFVEIVAKALRLFHGSLLAKDRLDSLVDPLSLAPGSPLIHPAGDDRLAPVDLYKLLSDAEKTYFVLLTTDVELLFHVDVVELVELSVLVRLQLLNLEATS